MPPTEIEIDAIGIGEEITEYVIEDWMRQNFKFLLNGPKINTFKSHSWLYLIATDLILSKNVMNILETSGKLKTTKELWVWRL